jgi:hypothetical protein
VGKPAEKGVVVIDTDQWAMYADVRIPANWTRLKVPSMRGFVWKANRGFAEFPNEPWYAWGGDDCIGRTKGWDTILSAATIGGFVSWGDDLHAHKCTHPFIEGGLCRQAGHVAYPAFQSQYVDYVWEQAAYRLGIARPRLDVIQEAHSFMPGEGATKPKMQADMTVLESRFMRQADKKLADDRLQLIIDEVVEKLKPVVGPRKCAS